MLDEITVRTEAADSLVAVRLVEAMVAEMEELYVLPPGSGLGTSADFAPPGGTFLVLYAGGRPVAGGGVMRDEDGVAEIKRMFVLPSARGRGHGRRVLDELEAAAAELGYRRLRLDTAQSLTTAIALYRGAGYRDIPDYNGNSYASYWGEKLLRR